MHITFDPDKVNWSDFMDQNSLTIPQFGNGYNTQFGYGDYFVGMPYQRGTGLGSIFKGLFRFLKPLGKSLAPIAKTVGREGLATTTRVLSDVLDGQQLSDAIKRETRQGVSNLLDKANTHLQKGSGRKRGRPRKAIKVGKTKEKLVLTSRVGPKPKRSQIKIDSLGYY